jgi:hypothetical protein
MLASAVVVVPTCHVYYDNDNYRCLGRDDENLNHTISDATGLGRSIGRRAADRHAHNAREKASGWGHGEEGLIEVQWDEAHLRLNMPVQAMNQIRAGYEEAWGQREKVLQHAQKVAEAERALYNLRANVSSLERDLEKMRRELTPEAITTRTQAIEAARQRVEAAKASLAEIKKQAP